VTIDLKQRQILLIVSAVLCASSACQSPQARVEPKIEFTKLPKADQGGPSNLATIEGRVTGARPGQRIVLFARSGIGVWWVQPFADQPYTTIQPDASWSSSTHLGTEYAAVLVEADYRPQATAKTLPEKGGAVAAVATAEGERTARRVTRTLHFSGYEWEIRQVPSDRGGALNAYDAANAWTDERGFLHLRIARDVGGWTCAEVILTRSLGYGSYRFAIQDTSHLEAAAVFGMFTWDDQGADQNHREIDIEVSRWGDASSKNGQYVVQPFYTPSNVVRFVVPPGPVTHSFRWQPGRVAFQSLAASGAPVAEQVLTSGVPLPGGESVRMNLYAFDNKRNSLRNPTEVVIEKFEYLP
jgi:hypothetical protein